MILREQDDENFCEMLRADLRGRLVGTLEGVVEDWAAHWFPAASIVERDALAMVAGLPDKIAAELVDALARRAAGSSGYGYERGDDEG